MWSIVRLSGKSKNSGQNLIEYALILGVVAVALLAMQTYFKRGIEGVIKVVADDYGPQGERIGSFELQAKRNLLTARGGMSTNSTSNSWQIRTIINPGESNIRTEAYGVVSTNTDSVSIAGDFN